MPLKGDNDPTLTSGTELPVRYVSLDQEMDAYDKLGPRAKRALDRCTFKFTALIWTEWCAQKGRDPLDPETDLMIANAIIRDERKGIADNPQVRPYQ